VAVVENGYRQPCAIEVVPPYYDGFLEADMRLLKLAKPVQAMLMEGALEMGHARALLALDGARQIEAANRVASKRLSVRETETLVQQLQRGPAGRPQPRA